MQKTAMFPSLYSSCSTAGRQFSIAESGQACMDAQEAAVLALKAKGNAQLQSGDLEAAVESYTQALALLDACPAPDPVLLAMLYSNRAAAQLKQCRWTAALQVC